MEILAVIGIIALLALLFTGGGLFGWLLRGLEVIFGFLVEGNQNCLGCIIKIIVAAIFLFGCAGLLGL